MSDTTPGTPPVEDWDCDYDIFDPDYVNDPYPVWEDLRGQCPIAHTDRWGGSWLPTEYNDVVNLACMVAELSSSDPIVAKSPNADGSYQAVNAPPLTADPDRPDDFVEWVRGVLELGLSQPHLRQKYREEIFGFFQEQLAERKANPEDDFLTELLNVEVEGKRLSDEHIVGTCNLMLVAGIDTTWSSIGSALWHLATHPEDRRRLAEDPALLPNAIEEFLRAYSPVTMAREVAQKVEYGGVTFEPGEKVLLNFPGANRDPEVFENPNEVDIGRRQNRHIAFGVGIHRCAGSNLARAEMLIAVGTWLERIPEFELADPNGVTWAGGQVRGPRHLPLRF